MFGGSFQIGRVYGIPIRVHVTLLIVLPLIALDFGRVIPAGGFAWGLVAAVGLFASIALHELGHSVVAISKGCRVRDILLLPIGGVAQMESIPNRPRDEFQMAIAGPAVSLALALLGLGGGRLLAAAGLYHPAMVSTLLGYTNLMLVLFNLLPSFPMDGGRVFRAWLTPKVGRLLATKIASSVGRFMAVAFGIFGLFRGNFFLVIIAIFIYQAAGAEYRTVQIQEASRRGFFGPRFSAEREWPYEEEIEVSPPPYRRGRTSTIFMRPLRAQHDLFDDLFHRWR